MFVFFFLTRVWIFWVYITTCRDAGFGRSLRATCSLTPCPSHMYQVLVCRKSNGRRLFKEWHVKLYRVLQQSEHGRDQCGMQQCPAKLRDTAPQQPYHFVFLHTRPQQQWVNFACNGQNEWTPGKSSWFCLLHFAVANAHIFIFIAAYRVVNMWPNWK